MLYSILEEGKDFRQLVPKHRNCLCWCYQVDTCMCGSGGEGKLIPACLVLVTFAIGKNPAILFHFEMVVSSFITIVSKNSSFLT